MGLTTVQQQTSDVVTHHSCTIQQPCEPAPMMAAKECAGCGKRIVERYLLKALDIFWHEDCLKCGCCDCRLGEVGSTLYIKANLILCKRDYLRLFGNTGSCSACNKMIPAYEMVMRAKYNVYHLECFACFACQHRYVLPFLLFAVDLIIQFCNWNNKNGKLCPHDVCECLQTNLKALMGWQFVVVFLTIKITFKYFFEKFPLNIFWKISVKNCHF